MNTKNPELKDQLRAAVDDIYSQNHNEDYIASENFTQSEFDEFDESDDYGKLPNVLSLRSIPIGEWDEIEVSPKSRFGDGLWDFTSFPHISRKQSRVNWDYVNYHGFNLHVQKHRNWLLISKALAFYRIPHFSVSNFVRSYGSLSSARTRITRLLQLFFDQNLYLGSPGDPIHLTMDDLSVDAVRKFIDDQPSIGVRWELASIIYFWQKLSAGKLLPEQFTIQQAFVNKAYVSQCRKAYDAVSEPFLPIPLDDYAAIVEHCVSVVELFGADILWLYQTYFPSIVGGYEYPERLSSRNTGVSPSSMKGIHAFEDYCPYSEDGVAWWALKVIYAEDGKRKARTAPWGYLKLPVITQYVASLIDACCVTILATTAMRRSEVVGLRSGCLERGPDGAWLHYTVFKTSSASQGIKKRIPIPDVTARAIELLEAIGVEARAYGKTDRLFVTVYRSHFGAATHEAFPGRAVDRVVEACGCSATVHPHRFRKTLAMYLLYQDPKNIEIIRQLFSHKSLKMTLRYVMSLPGVNDEIKSIIVEQNVDVLVEVLDAAIRGKIGGEAGKRLRAAAADPTGLAATLHDGGKEVLVQYVDSMLDQGLKILHRTSLGVCMKTPGYTEPAPCDGKYEGAVEKLHPNLFACEPFGCQFAVFLERNIPSLQSEVVFHHRLAKHEYSSPSQVQFSNRRIKDALKRLTELGEEFSEETIRAMANG